MFVSSIRPLQISSSQRDDCLTIQPAVLNFGEVKIGKKSMIQITLINNGAYELKLTPNSSNHQFYFSDRMIRLNGYQTRTIDLFYRPTIAQFINAQLQLNSEAHCQRVISVSGLGVK